VSASRSLASRGSVPVRSLALAGLILLLLVLGIAGCAGSSPSAGKFQNGSSNGSDAPPSAGDAYPAAMVAAAPTAAPAAPAQPADSASNSSSESPVPAPNLQAANPPIPLDRMVIRNARLTLQVDNVEASLSRIRNLADTYGGYVSNSHTSFVRDGDQDHMVADLTIAVRADSFDKAVAGIRQTATKVESEDGTSQDVTDQYTDLDANLRNLQASEAAIIKLTDKATNLTDVLTLERELATVRGEIEKVQGRKNLLEHQSSMSTIAISMHLPSTPVVQAKVAEPAWNPLATFAKGWHTSIVGLEWLADGLISLVALLWWTVPIGVLGFYFYRRGRRNREARASVLS
jgi:hypothetical protein